MKELDRHAGAGRVQVVGAIHREVPREARIAARPHGVGRRCFPMDLFPSLSQAETFLEFLVEPMWECELVSIRIPLFPPQSRQRRQQGDPPVHGEVSGEVSTEPQPHPFPNQVREMAPPLVEQRTVGTVSEEKSSSMSRYGPVVLLCRAETQRIRAWR